MTATDELRRLLDERGVKWDYGITGATTTRFSVNGIDLTFTPMRDGLVCSTILTPAQAIVATLGDADERNSKLFEAAKKWMAKAAHFEAENAKLREMVDYMTPIALYSASERERDELRKLGVEVSE